MLVVLAFNVYRGVTQSITTDEAFTYLNFASKPYAGLQQTFDANNHVLNSILGHLSVAVFGLHEWSLRLPSVAGGALYLFAAYGLCFLIFGGGAWSFLTFALLTTNPFLLDYLSAARGYGLGVGFLMLSTYALVRVLMESGPGSLYLAGICFGLSVTANLTSLFPAAAITVAFAAVAVVSDRLSFRQLWSELLVPAILVAFPLLVVPLSKTQSANFYFGAKGMAEFVNSLIDSSFCYDAVRLHQLGGFGGALLLLKTAIGPLLVVLLLACVVVTARGLRELRLGRGTRTKRAELRVCCLTGLAFTMALLLVVAAHLATGAPYPLRRTGLYFVPLAMLAASTVAYGYRAQRTARLAAGALAISCVISFAAQANVSSYAEWRFDAGTKRIVQSIRSRYSRKKHLTVRASWVLEPTLNFYRVLYGMNWDPIDRSGADGPADVFILTTADQGSLSRLREVYRDAVSDEVLAVPR